MKVTKGTTEFTLVDKVLRYDKFQNVKSFYTIKSYDKVSGKEVIHTLESLSFKEAVNQLVPNNRVGDRI